MLEVLNQKNKMAMMEQGSGNPAAGPNQTQEYGPTRTLAELSFLRDWASTPVGPVESWPDNLRTIAALVLASPVPMAICWRSEAVLLCNDAYARLIEPRQPNAKGRPAVDAEPCLEDLQRCAQALTPADSGWDVSLTPIRNNAGTLDGALAILTRSAPPETFTVREVHHRVTNNLQLIASLVNLQANQIDDVRVQALFDGTRSRIHAIAATFGVVSRLPGERRIDMTAFARQLVPELMRLHGRDDAIQVGIQGSDASIEVERAAAFGLLLNELCSNVCRHAFPTGTPGVVRVRIGRENNDNIVAVSDNGIGLPPGFDDRAASSLGFQLIHMLAEQLGGTVNIASRNGARVEVRFPSAAGGHRS